MFNIFKKKKKEPIRPRTLMGTLGILYHSGTYPKIPSIICADGCEFGISYDLSEERTTDTLFISYLLIDEPLLAPYKSNKNEYSPLIESYSYVPISLVRHIVEDLHGGIIGWEGLKEAEEYNRSNVKCIPLRSTILPYKI